MAVIGLFFIIAVFLIVGIIYAEIDRREKRRKQGYGTHQGYPDEYKISPPR